MIRDGADSKTPVGPDSDKKNQETHPNLEGFGRSEPEDNQPLIAQDTLIPVTPSGMVDRYHIFSDSTLLILTAVVWLGYAGLWIFYGFAKDPMWNHSQNIIARLSQHEGFLEYFSAAIVLVYRLYKIIIPVLILVAPRKDIALRSITMIIVNDTVQEFIRLAVLEGRPFFDGQDLVIHNHCICSFGMPSGHAQGTTMLCLIVIYEIYLQVRVSKLRVFLLFSTCSAILVSMMVGRLYLARHSLPQLILGSWQTLAIFTLVLYCGPTLNKLSQEFLQQNLLVGKGVIALSSLFAAVSTALWYGIFEQMIIGKNLPHIRCHECWANSSLNFRMNLGPNLMIVWVLPGLFIGLQVANCSWKICDYGLIRQHISLKGFVRLLIVLVCFSPRIMHILVSLPLEQAMPFSILTNFLAGFLLGYIPLKIFDISNLKFPGDLMIK